MLRNGLQIQHILLLLVACLVIFGAGKLPDVARNLGKSMRVMKAELKDLREDQAPAEQPAPAAQPVTAQTQVGEHQAHVAPAAPVGPGDSSARQV